jgi:hypothetical protein
MGYGWCGNGFTKENALSMSETVLEKVLAAYQRWFFTFEMMMTAVSMVCESKTFVSNMTTARRRSSFV